MTPTPTPTEERMLSFPLLSSGAATPAPLSISETEFWNARRVKLESDLRKAALDLFEHSGSAALAIDLDPPHGKLMLTCGAPTAGEVTPTARNEIERLWATFQSNARRVLQNGGHNYDDACRLANESMLRSFPEVSAMLAKSPPQGDGTHETGRK